MKVKTTKPYISRKGRYADGERKYIIEENGAQLGVVPKVEKLIEMLRQYGLNIKPYSKEGENEQNNDHKFAHDTLTEPAQRSKIRKKLLTDEERKLLFEFKK